jgi:hypothetical protein
MRRALRCLVLSTLLFAAQAGATAQRGDKLLLDGEVVTLHTNPLSEWLAAHPKALPRGTVQSSGSWRGYVATWEIAGGKLWLRKVDVAYSKGTEPGATVPRREDNDRFETVDHDYLRMLFPEGSPVARWYTGTLIVPKGKLVHYVHMGYGSTFERYTVVWVRAGEVVRRLDLDAAQFTELRRERFAAYRKTAEYREHLAKIDGTDLEDKEQFLFDFLSERYLSQELESGK